MGFREVRRNLIAFSDTFSIRREGLVCFLLRMTWKFEDLHALKESLLVEGAAEDFDRFVRQECLAQSACAFFIKYLKNLETADIASEIVQLLTPVDVLCGSATKRFSKYHFMASEITIELGDQEELGLGFKVWGCAESMMGHLEIGTVPVKGKTVLELGAGLGLLSICAAAAGAEAVLATDLIPRLLDIAGLNFQRNSGATENCAMNTAVLDWQFPGSCEAAKNLTGAVLLASDVIYENAHSDMLNSCIAFLIDSGIVCEAWVALKKSRPGVSAFLNFPGNRSIVYEEEGIILVRLLH